jgi:hypothetical protein
MRNESGGRREEKPAQDRRRHAAEREPADDLDVDLVPVEADPAQVADQTAQTVRIGMASRTPKSTTRNGSSTRGAAEARDRRQQRPQKGAAREQQQIGRETASGIFIFSPTSASTPV